VACVDADDQELQSLCKP